MPFGGFARSGRPRELFMNARLITRLTAPVIAISLLLLAVGVGAAWEVHRWQKAVSHDLRVRVSGVRAAEELEILVREARTRLDHFLIVGDPKYLGEVPELRAETEHWLGEAERWGVTRHERALLARVRKGQQRFWSDLERIRAQVPDAGVPAQLRTLIAEVLVREVQEPAHEFLDLNEKEVEDSIANNQAFADRLVYGLLLLGTCGSAAGLVAGFGFARALRRSLVQLSVLVRDAAGRLEPGMDPITFAGTSLGELASVLRVIGDRVGAIVERAQQRERDFLRTEQLAAVGQLAAGMAHELRNPLTSMKILVQGAMAGCENGVEDSWSYPRLSVRDLTILEEEITRLEGMIQSFLDFARPPETAKRVLEIRPLVEQTLVLVSARAATLGARVELTVPETPVRVAVDPGQFRQVLLNLLLNALDAMPGGGTITVRLEEERDGTMMVQVADRGCGLPADLGERIFDPFTTTKESGLGLGLSICKRIATAHGGTITGTNRPDGGAVFTFRLPAQPSGSAPRAHCASDAISCRTPDA
jgi:signal transduction histidine kinase